MAAVEPAKSACEAGIRRDRQSSREAVPDQLGVDEEGAEVDISEQPVIDVTALDAAFQTLVTGLAVRYYKAVAGVGE